MEAGPNMFAFRLFQHLMSEEPRKNILCSPYSVSSAMSMVLLGAGGNTKLELENALCAKSSEAHKKAKLVQDSLQSNKSVGQSLHIANELFLEKSFAVKEQFTSDLMTHYKSSVNSQDFKGNPEGSRDAINKWVSAETQGKITDLMPPTSISIDTRLVLVNAIHFKGKWETQFTKSNTNVQDFRTSEGKLVKVDMMTKKAKYPLAMDSNGQMMMIELPYQDLPISMLIILPNENLNALEKSLNADVFASLCSSLFKEEVVLGLPKFKLEFEKDLCDAFKKFGACSLFSSSANLHGISDAEDLGISAISHKAYIAVDEEGTEAAAATGIAISRMALLPPTQFICNKPFLFFLYHKPTKSILFTGRMQDPSA